MAEFWLKVTAACVFGISALLFVGWLADSSSARPEDDVDERRRRAKQQQPSSPKVVQQQAVTRSPESILLDVMFEVDKVSSELHQEMPMASAHNAQQLHEQCRTHEVVLMQCQDIVDKIDDGALRDEKKKATRQIQALLNEVDRFAEQLITISTSSSPS